MRRGKVFLRYLCWSVLIAVGTLGLVGCTVGPDYKRPVTAATGQTQFAWLPAGWADANGICDPNFANAWWREFNDPVTDDLVQKALRHNTNLIAAAATVEQAQALLAQAFGARLPDVGLGLNRVQQRQSFTLPAPIGRQSFLSKNYSLEVSVSYMVDIFGKLRRAEQAAEYDLFAGENDRQTLAHAIVAQVIQARIEVATLQRLLEINRQTIANWERALEVIDRRYQQGLVTAVDVYIARENLAGAKAQKIQTEQSLILTLHALDVLCGQAPATTTVIAGVLPDMPEMSAIPAGLPAHLLDRRPDVRAAEMRLAAATERIGVSVTQLYPDLTLTGTTGTSSDDLSDLLDWDSRVYAGIINFAQPVFKGGRLKAGVKAAKAATEAAAAQYAGTVLTAMREVEDALVTQQMLTAQIEQLNDRFVQAQHAERLATKQYNEGVGTILLSLETERRRRQAENELALVQGELWKSRVQLFLALGGDWGIEEVVPEKAASMN